MGKKKMTAAELMAKLSMEKQYLAKMQEKNNQTKLFEDLLKKDEQPLLDLLKKNGLVIESVWDLVNSNMNYINVIPILLDSLKQGYHLRTKAGIARSLAIQEAKEEGWNILLHEYLKAIPDEDISEANKKGYKEGLAVALSVLMNESELDVVLELLQDKKHRSSRLYFLDAVFPFRNNDKVKKVVMKLTNDTDLKKMIQEKFIK